jgi:DNA-binding PadR family transcriptional regulator
MFDDDMFGVEFAGGFHPRDRFEHRGHWGHHGPGMVERGLWMMRRHFPFGPPSRGTRMFARGDLKFALLDLLQERPKYGYELMKELEEKAGGFYTPSAGAIYPTLQMMEERGWVTSETVDGKKVYTLTDAGRATVQENAATHEKEEQFEHLREHLHEHGPGPMRGGPWAHHRHPFGQEARPELAALRNEGAEVARLIWTSVMVSGGDPQRLQRLRAIVTHTREELEAFLVNKPGDSQAPSQESTEQKPTDDAATQI